MKCSFSQEVSTHSGWSLTWVFGLCKYTFKVFASIMKYASSGSRALKMASVGAVVAGVVVQDANALLLLLLLLHSLCLGNKRRWSRDPKKIYQCYLASSSKSSPTQKFKRRQDSFFLFSGSTLSLLPLVTGRTWDPILWSLVEVHSITSLDLKKKKTLEFLDSESCTINFLDSLKAKGT